VTGLTIMGKYILQRLLMLVPILLGVSFLTFAIAQATPGDPVSLMLGAYATPDQVAKLRDQLGLNDPFLVQYFHYIWKALHGDLGKSIRAQTPVMDEILARAISTLQLTVAGMLMAIAGGISAGVIAAMTNNKLVSGAVMVTAMIGLSMPSFWLAIILIIVFGVRLNWVSVTGGAGLRDLILPSFCLALGPAAVLARLVRSCILEVAHEDYVRTARSKGLSERVVILRHVLPNALIPVVTVVGLQFALLLSGTFFIESVFARPGLGRFAVEAISARDYPQIQGIVLFIASVYVLVNLAVDVLYGVLDPRIRPD
jgi:peptide/nickel transport system permease protein